VSACCHRHACTQYYCCHREQRDTVNSISLDTSGVTNCAFCLLYTNRKDGYRQRNVRQFLYILASPGYAPGTIAVNVTWMERGFNKSITKCPRNTKICRKVAHPMCNAHNVRLVPKPKVSRLRTSNLIGGWCMGYQLPWPAID